MRGIYLIFIFLISSLQNLSVAQQFEYHIGTVGLDKVKDNIYKDKSGNCLGTSIILTEHAELLKLRDKYSNKSVKKNKVKKGNLELVVAKPQISWVKVKSSNPCYSPNPDGCLVWCKKQVPKRVLSIKVVDDSKPIRLEDFDSDTQAMLIDSGFIAFSPTECNVDPGTIIYVREELELYFDQSIEASSFLDYLRMYQFENDLPIGNLNSETLALIENQ